MALSGQKHEAIQTANAAAVSNIGTLNPPSGYVAPTQGGRTIINQTELNASIVVANLNTRQ
jgi:hypothetical protein